MTDLITLLIKYMNFFNLGIFNTRKSKMRNIKFMLLALAICSSPISFASGLSVGDAQVDTGELKLSGAIRTRFQHKDFADSASEGSNDDWKLADLKMVLSYENPNWLASVDARCYQYDKLCDAVFLVDAFAGYKIDEQQKVTGGLQPVDFGLGRFWGSSYYETLFNTLGYEDVHNLGLKYQFKDQDYQVTLGYYLRDGGNYKGTSIDSSRYTGNFVKADNLEQGTYIREKNMWVGRASKTFQWNTEQKFNSEIGASFWYSDLENRKTGLTGHKSNWNIFTQNRYQHWQLLTVAGQQRINNKDDEMPDYSTLGAFDYAYQIANDARYLMTELNYSVQAEPYGITGIKPYFSYSHYFKDKSFKDKQSDIDSNRIITGLAFNYKKIGIQAEYILSRNDAMIGGSANALAQGDKDKWDRLLYLALGYYF